MDGNQEALAQGAVTVVDLGQLLAERDAAVAAANAASAALAARDAELAALAQRDAERDAELAQSNAERDAAVAANTQLVAQLDVSEARNRFISQGMIQYHVVCLCVDLSFALQCSTKCCFSFFAHGLFPAQNNLSG
jgi:multidrug efflux pump subunit AcrA (membrane-fusion protein)